MPISPTSESRVPTMRSARAQTWSPPRMASSCSTHIGPNGRYISQSERPGKRRLRSQSNRRRSAVGPLVTGSRAHSATRSNGSADGDHLVTRSSESMTSAPGAAARCPAKKLSRPRSSPRRRRPDTGGFHPSTVRRASRPGIGCSRPGSGRVARFLPGLHRPELPSHLRRRRHRRHGPGVHVDQAVDTQRVRRRPLGRRRHRQPRAGADFIGRLVESGATAIAVELLSRDPRQLVDLITEHLLPVVT